MFAASKSGSVDAKDPQFNYVTMLLHGNGTNGAQNNTFVDSSTNNFTITRNGNTTQGTFTPYGSNWSNYFDGSGDTLNTASNAAFGFGSGAWTFEAWVYPTTSQTDNWIIATNDAGKLRMRVGASGYLSFYTDTGSISLNSTTVVTVNAWSHVAICYDGTTLSLFQNGTRTATSTVSISNGSANACYIGSNTIGGGYWNGYISNARVVKGSAVYSGATYTVPTTPLTAITNTSLLTCADNRFIDDSTNNFTITKTGDVSVQRFSPFSPTTAYSTSVIGGSGYFDGSGDSLSVATTTALSFGTGDFTIEGWVYKTAAANASFVDGRVNPGGAAPWAFYVDASNYPYFYDGSVYSSSVAISLNAWNHIVAVRTSGTLKIFVNGVQGYSAALSTNLDRSAGAFIGVSANTSSPSAYWQGYINDLRIVKGTAVYTAAFTPPTAPLTAITNTQLLLSCTNAGILDNAMMNDLETVGNAQISTSVKKFGTGSMYFDGTGDYLMSIANQSLELGSGDYTLECWVNISAAAANGGIISKGPIGNLTNTTWSLEFNGSANTVSYYVYNANNAVYIINGTSNIKTSTWIHLAICRSGNNTRLFVNGTQEGSTYTSGYTISAGDNLYIGGGFYAPTTRTITGYIDDLRISKVARYASNFTAPSAPFADKG